MSDTYYPLLFKYQDLVAGNGFVAGVATCGHALLSIDADEAWIDGVAPTGFGAGGSDPKEASTNFRNRYLEILWDLSYESKTFEDFRAQVEGLFSQTYEKAEKIWLEGVERVRRNGESLEGFSRKSADDHKPSIEVVEISTEDADNDHKQRPKPDFNTPYILEQAA